MSGAAAPMSAADASKIMGAVKRMFEDWVKPTKATIDCAPLQAIADGLHVVVPAAEWNNRPRGSEEQARMIQTLKSAIVDLREAVTDAADEWQKHVEVDSAPHSNATEINMAITKVLEKHGLKL